MSNLRKYKNVFQKLNQDIAKNKYSPEVYYDGSNVRIIAHTAQSSFAVSNIKGEELKLTIPSITRVGLNNGVYEYRYQIGMQLFSYFTTQNLGNMGTFQNLLSVPRVIGHSVVKNKVILFVAYSDSEQPVQRPGSIWEYDILTNTLILKYLNRLNFSTAHPVEALSFYQNSNVIKTYFLNYFHQLRHINTEQVDLPELPLDFLDISPEIITTQPEIINVNQFGGVFKAGRVAYAFNYVNRNGVQTKISPISLLYNVNKANTGNLVEDDIEVSFEIQINNLREDFDFIRVYRLFYSLPLGEPVITLFKEEPVTSSSTTFTDDNNELISSMSLGEFLLLGSDPFIPQTLDSIENRLFTSNHKYKFFNPIIDSRVYRFNSNSESLIFNKANQSQTVTSANWLSVPANHDCINPSIKAETNNNAEIAQADDQYYNEFIYQEDGTTLGAEGPYFKISIDETHKVPYQQEGSSDFNIRVVTDNSFLDPLRAGFLNLKRDETYRLAVQFRNKYGQWSFANWLCDFRLPNPHEASIVDSDGNYIQLQLKVELKQSGRTLLEGQEVTAWRVVRVPRKQSDKTVMSQGFVSEVNTPDTVNLPDVYRIRKEAIGIWSGAFQVYNFGNALDSTPSKILEYRSTDLNFQTSPSGYLIVHSLYTVTQSYKAIDENGTVSQSIPFADYKQEEFIYAPPYGPTSNHGRISEGVIRVNPSQNSNILIFDRNSLKQAIISEGINNYIVHNQLTQNINATPKRDAHNTGNFGLFLHTSESFVKQLGYELYTTIQSPQYAVFMADLKRVVPNQYGGNTFSDRTRSIYVQSSKTVLLSQSEVNVYGDTVVTNMRYQRSQPRFLESAYLNTAGGQKASSLDYYYIPCELTINDDFRLSSIFNNERWDGKIEDFHQYNLIYSRTDLNEAPAFPKPLHYIPTEIVDSETRYSDLKQNDEIFDSWTVFREGNKNQVEGIYGGIKRIISNGGKLFFFQEFAYGVWNVNPRVQVQGQDGLALELGRGDVLHDYTYISTNIGCQNKWSISKSIYGLVFYDQMNKTLRMIDDSSKELNVLGINTFIKNLPEFKDNPAQRNCIISTFYQNTNETFISFVKPDKTTTWVYNHLTGGFTNKIPNEPIWYISSLGRMFIIQRGNQPTTQQIWEMDKGDYGFFNKEYQPSYVTIVLSEDSDFTKILTNLSWNSELYDEDGNDVFNETITHIRIYNDYQDTGLVALDDKNSSRRFRTWRYTAPIIGAATRLRSQYFFVELHFKNSNNKHLILQDVISDAIL
jgi:hypothetical protein